MEPKLKISMDDGVILVEGGTIPIQNVEVEVETRSIPLTDAFNTFPSFGIAGSRKVITFTVFGKHVELISKEEPKPKKLPKIQPCPFCEAEAEVLSESYGSRWLVRCKNIQFCGFNTPKAIKKEEAIDQWNYMTDVI